MWYCSVSPYAIVILFSSWIDLLHAHTHTHTHIHTHTHLYTYIYIHIVRERERERERDRGNPSNLIIFSIWFFSTTDQLIVKIQTNVLYLNFCSLLIYLSALFMPLFISQILSWVHIYIYIYIYIYICVCVCVCVCVINIYAVVYFSASFCYLPPPQRGLISWRGICQLSYTLICNNSSQELGTSGSL